MKIVNIEYTDTLETLKEANKARLFNKNNWIQLNVSKGENLIQVKTFNTSIQTIQAWGSKCYRDGGGWDLTATEWKAQLVKHFEVALTN